MKKQYFRKKAYICSFLSLLACACIFAGCKEKQIDPLDAPTNLTVEQDILTWTEVEGAEKYLVQIDENEYYADCNRFDIFDLTDKVQTYNIAVTAVGDGKSHADSPCAVIEYTVNSLSPCWTVREINDGDAYEILSSQGLSMNKQKFIIPSVYEDGKPIVQIAKNAFNQSMLSLIIPDGITVIKDSAFNGCGILSRVRLPNTLTEIGRNAFAGCRALTEITIPDSVKKLDGFAWCSSLKEFHIPASVEEIDPHVLNGCTALEKITVDENNPYYESKNNCIIRKSDGVLIAGCKTSVIPDGVNEIGEYAFVNLTTLSTFVIPNSVKKIGKHAFDGCSSLFLDKLPENLQEIGEYAFYGSNVFSHFPLIIPKSVKRIGTYAFGHESSDIPDVFPRVILPNTVEYVGAYAFWKATVYTDCSHMDTLMGSNPFAVTIYNCTFGYDGGVPYVLSVRHIPQDGNVRPSYSIDGISPQIPPMREGYTFMGWSTEEGSDNIVIGKTSAPLGHENTYAEVTFSTADLKKFTEETVFYAVWVKNA